MAGNNWNVVLILLDAASASHFGCYGYTRATTPSIDRVAREGIVFENAYTNAVYTLASTATLFTGQLPARHGILTHKNKLPGAALTLAERLRQSGYETSAFLANGNASAIFGLTQGFQTVEDVFRKKDYVGWGSDLTDSFRKWLPRNRANRFFAYLHYREPHDPYNPPEPWIRKFTDPAYTGSVGRTFDARTAIKTNDPGLTDEDRSQIVNLYDANLAYADSEVQRVLDALKQNGIDDRTVVIVTADHGEAFYEHGYQGHNRQVYEESARIPLILRFPAAAEIPRTKIASPYQNADLFPSILDVLDVPLPRGPELDGRSFWPVLHGKAVPPRLITIRSTQSSVSAILKQNYKFIQTTGGKELFNLSTDPRERLNLIDVRPILTGYFKQKLAEMTPEMRKPSKSDEVVLDREAEENLKALGYLN